MAEDIICNIIRTGATGPIASNIVVQLSKVSPIVAAQQGIDPLLYVNCYTTMLPLNNPQLIRFDDYLVDQFIVDAITNLNRVWQIVSDPSMDAVTGDWKFAAVRTREVK